MSYKIIPKGACTELIVVHPCKCVKEYIVPPDALNPDVVQQKADHYNTHLCNGCQTKAYKPI